jgi:hypothetical protein
MKPLAAAFLLLTVSLLAQGPAPAPDPFKPLAFLEGNWEADTHDSGGVHVVGVYAFKTELAGHILARHAVSVAACKGPDTFDCEHSDLLYVFV